MEHTPSPYIFIVERSPEPLPEACPFTRDRGCILFVVRKMGQLGSLRRQRIILRLVDALHVVVMDSRLVILVENMATTTSSNLEVLEVDLNGTTSNSLRSSLLIIGSTFFIFPCLVMSI